MIISKISEIKSQSMFIHLNQFLDSTPNFYLKLEGLNIAGSIKLRTAQFLLDGLEQRNEIRPGYNHIIESSSGSLGVALSILCKERGYPFTCVTDPNIVPVNERLMQIYGAYIIKVTQKDSAGGYLNTRIELIKKLISEKKEYIWTNQYANQDNSQAHYHETAVQILSEFERIDYLVVGAGTTGTLMGCCRYFKEYSPHTKLIAVDALGSVTFDQPAGKRTIPGLGTSLKPSLVDKSIISELVLIDELTTVKTCHYFLEKYGLFIGGSTGTVLGGVEKIAKKYNPTGTVIAISPDFGDKYIDTLYNPQWLDSKALIYV